MTYLVIYEKTATGFSAYVPDLPGCITTGSDLEETERNMKEAIEFHLSGLNEDGEPIPEPAAVAATLLSVSDAGDSKRRAGRSTTEEVA